MSPRYSLMFSGELLPGLSVEIAAQRLASQLGIGEPARLLPLFCGKPVTLRRNLSVQEAREHFLALRKAGLEVYLQPSRKSAIEVQPDNPSPAAHALANGTERGISAELEDSSPAGAMRGSQTRPNALQGLIYAALIAASLVILRLALLPAALPPLQLLAAGTDAQQRLWLVDNQQLHRMSRVDETERSETLPNGWISEGMSPLLAVLDDNSVLLSGQRETGWTLLRCSLTAPAVCAALPLAPSFTATPGFVVRGTSGEIIAVDYSRQEILLLDEQGAVIAHAEHAASEDAAPVIQQGLLYLSSATTPGLDVLSIDRESFGQQLDQLLVDPKFVADTERVSAAVAVDTGWWLLLRDTSTEGPAAKHRLISVDQYLAKPLSLPLTADHPRALIKQGPRVLLLHAGADALDQFSLSGQAGKAVVVTAIAQHNQSQQSRESAARWQLGLAAAALLLAALFAALFDGIGLARHTRRAEP